MIETVKIKIIFLTYLTKINYVDNFLHLLSLILSGFSKL